MTDKYKPLRDLGLDKSGALDRAEMFLRRTMVIRADDVLKLIEAAPVVKWNQAEMAGLARKWTSVNCAFDDECLAGNETHEGYIFGIKPIVKDTAEGLLRELLRLIEHNCIVEYRGATPPSSLILAEIKERAKKLLEDENDRIRKCI